MRESNGPPVPATELPSELAMRPYIKRIGERGGEDNGSNVELIARQDPRFTEEVVAAMQGPVDVIAGEEVANGESKLELTQYLGSYAEGEGAMDSLENYMASDKQTHIWGAEGHGSKTIVELADVTFPPEKHEQLEALGVHLDAAGSMLGIGPSSEAETAETVVRPGLSGEEESGAESKQEGMLPIPEESQPEPEQQAATEEPDSAVLPAEEEFPPVEDEENPPPADPLEGIEPAGTEPSEGNEPPAAQPSEASGAEEVSTEGLPESISNNYNLHQRESGLIVAESRANHSSRVHKSDIPEIEPEHNKQRGIVERKRIHPDTGQVYYVAERPDSMPARHADTHPDENPSPEESAADPHQPGAETSHREPQAGPEVATSPEEQDEEHGQLAPETFIIHNGEVNQEPPSEPNKYFDSYKVESSYAGESYDGQDAILAREDLGLYGVFDGHGYDGLARKYDLTKISEEAREASRVAATAIDRIYSEREKEPENVDEALKFAQKALAETRKEVSETGGHSSALFVKIERIRGTDFLIWANAGDNLVFRQRIDGDTENLTELTAGRNVIFGPLGPEFDHESQEYKAIDTPSPNEGDRVGFIDLKDGDRFVLCTPGLIGGQMDNSMMEAKELEQILEQNSVDEAAAKAVELSRRQDDKSVIVLDFQAHDK